MRRAALILFLWSSGCGGESRRYKSYPPDPYPDIRLVAVLPVLNQTLEPRLDGVEFADIIASELIKFEGFRVIRPQQMPLDFVKALHEGKMGVEDVLRATRALKADAVLVTAMTDYEAYNPPRIGMSVQLLRAAGRTVSSAEIDRIVQSASWRRGPLPVPRERAGNWMAAFEEIYDAHEQRIRKEIVAYSQAQEGGDTPFQGEQEFLAVQSRYQQFVANQVIHRLLALTVTDGH